MNCTPKVGHNFRGAFMMYDKDDKLRWFSPFAGEHFIPTAATFFRFRTLIFAFILQLQAIWPCPETMLDILRTARQSIRSCYG